MSRMKKIVVSVILGLITIFGIHSASNAYYVGQSLNVSYNTYASSSNIFCMEHGQRLKASNQYTIVSNVKIDGIKSTDHKGKSIESKYNARFAYIIGATKTSAKSIVSNAVWNFGYTWMDKVGKNHHGLYKGFASSAKGGTETLNAEAQKYADNLGSMGKIEDKTNKKKIQVESYEKDGKSYSRIGPFKWNYSGSLSDVKVYDENKKVIPNVKYSIFNGNTEKFISADKITSGKEFYISIQADSGVSKISSIKGKVKYDVKTANIWFLKAKTVDRQNLIIVNPGSHTANLETEIDYDIDLFGDLSIVKVDRDNNEKKLEGVKFKFQNKSTGKYVKKTGNTISYVDNKDKATEFETDSNGKIEIKNLIVGDYIAYETKNPNSKYEIIKDGINLSVTVKKKEDTKIPNTQIKVDLSGYVWIDKISEKQSKRNNLYKDGDYDPDDILLDGIKVKLMRQGKSDPIATATTSELKRYTNPNNGHGEYLFKDIPLYDDNDKERKNKILDQYYIEFEYDGVTYTNVVPTLNKNNGSKAKENDSKRQEFNNGFATVEGNTRDTGITKDLNGNKSHDLYYDMSEKHKAILDKTKSYYSMTSSTKEAGYNIKTVYKAGDEEIKYINLGLYEREMPDIALVKDLSSVKMTINGKTHVYEYDQRFKNQGEYGDGFNVGVKFENKYRSQTYTRAIYKSDYEYETSDESKELKVYATYRIKIRNESTNLKNLKTKVNNIVDYYDAKYQLIKVGTGISEGSITGEIEALQKDTYNEKYNKAIININKEIEAQTDTDIYVQFELNRDAVLNILNNKENLNNVVEINSYSVFDEKGKVYAGIDKDSNPGNAIPGNNDTYEDDTDEAPGLLLEVAGKVRELTGKVFLDSTSNELKTGEVRQGDGIYGKDANDESKDEKGIPGALVTLTENSGSGKVYTTETDGNGDFFISEYIPGDYTLTYTWGGQTWEDETGNKETYTVQNYKGTVVDKTRWDNNNSNAEWYKQDVDTRYSDAIDNYRIEQEKPKGSRLQIDEEIRNQVDTYERTKMDSTTPTMDMEIEITSTTTTSFDDKFIPEGYNVRNVDFGIVERARQRIALKKRVKTFKVTLANGQVIADVTIDENGNLSGEKNHVTYMKPMPGNGFVKLELDNELIQGATIEVTYEIKVVNNSELDYISDKFYLYGIEEGEKVTITPSAIVDYLDKDWAFDQNKNTQWTVKNLEDIKNMVEEIVYIDEESTIADKIILYTEALKEKKIEPGKSEHVDLLVSKVLSNSDEISLDNETEITERQKDGGAPIDTIPGNYVPGKGPQESDDSIAETVIVTPNTGNNLDFIVPIVVGITALVILGTGVILIKRKALEK